MISSESTTLPVQSLSEYGWEENPTDSKPDVIYCPLAARSPHILHVPHAMGAKVLAGQGASIVFGVESATVPPDLENRIRGWVGESRAVNFVALDIGPEMPAGADEPYPTNPYVIAQDLVRYYKDSGLDGEGSWFGKFLSRDEDQVTVEIFMRSMASAARRLETPGLIIPGLHTLLNSGHKNVMVLSGADERSKWQDWNAIYGNRTDASISHLCFPEVQVVSGDTRPAMPTDWGHPDDLDQWFRKSLEVVDDLSALSHGDAIRWIVEQGLLVPQLVSNSERLLWNDLVLRLRDDTEEIAESITRRYLLQAV